MGQSSSAAKCSEPLESCLNCETCDTERKVCVAWKKDAVDEYREDMLKYSESNTNKLNTLKKVHNQLDSDVREIRRISDLSLIHI